MNAGVLTRDKIVRFVCQCVRIDIINYKFQQVHAEKFNPYLFSTNNQILYKWMNKSC